MANGVEQGITTGIGSTSLQRRHEGHRRDTRRSRGVRVRGLARIRTSRHPHGKCVPWPRRVAIVALERDIMAGDCSCPSLRLVWTGCASLGRGLSLVDALSLHGPLYAAPSLHCSQSLSALSTLAARSPAQAHSRPLAATLPLSSACIHTRSCASPPTSLRRRTIRRAYMHHTSRCVTRATLRAPP